MTNKLNFNEADEEALQREYERDRKETKQAESKVPITFLEKGISTVRILPPFGNSKLWFHEVKKVWVSPDGSKKRVPYISPSMFGQSCPFMEEGKRLFALGGNDNIEKAKGYRPKTSYLFNILLITSPSKTDVKTNLSEGVKVLDAPMVVKKALLDLNQDVAGGWGNVTSLEDGFDVRIEKTGADLNTQYVVKGIPKRSNIVSIIEHYGLKPEEVIKPHDLSKVYFAMSYDKLKEILETSNKPFEFMSQSTKDGIIKLHENIIKDSQAPLDKTEVPVNLKMPEIGIPALSFDVPNAPSKE